MPPVKWPVQDFATGIDVEIRGALNCGEEAKASYNGGAQECIASCEAEVDPAGFVLALLGDQQGTVCSFGSPHAPPEGIAMWVRQVQEGALPRGEVARWILCLLQRDLVGLIARGRSFRTGLSCALAASAGVLGQLGARVRVVFVRMDEVPKALYPGDHVVLVSAFLCSAQRFRDMQALRKG